MVYRFLLVSLNIDAILGEVTVSARRQKLKEMTQGNHLGDAYATTLDRMKAQKDGRSSLGMGALMWVSNSERPLHTSELCHALGVKIGSTDLDHENVPEIQTILRCSLGFITVEASSSTVRLVHSTLQEYLSNNPSLFLSPHSMIAEVCLTYLNFRYIRELSSTPNPASPTASLVEYASCYWGNHIRREKTECASQLALKLLIGFERHISSQVLLLHYHDSGPWWDWCFYERDGPNDFTGLHGAAFLGISELVDGLLGMKEWDISAADTLGRTALAWAAIGGHDEVVRILLQQKDINPNTADTQYNRTPLLWAAERGNEGVVRLLLEREDINPNIADTGYGRTPLLWAVEGGHQRVVKLLLERWDIDPNTPDTQYGRTPLQWAMERGHQGVVELLLERVDIDPNTANTQDNRTILSQAAEGGYQGVVQLLLERADIDPNTVDTKYGRTPLWWAAKGGHEGIIRLLLEREDINPDTPDTKYSRTPLLAAAAGGHEKAVGLLLQRKDLNPNTQDTKFGGTPLRWATEHGYEVIVRLLLEREDINPNTPDTEDGRTPLRWAAYRGYEGIIRLLLKRDDINPNTPDSSYGRTPLLMAAVGGHEGVVSLLLHRKDTNPNTTEIQFGGTPLWWAAVGGYEGIVRLLLEREDTNPDIPALSGETAFKVAVSQGHVGVVRLLSRAKPSPPIPTDTKQVGNMGKTLQQVNILNTSSKKRTIFLSDDGKSRKKSLWSLT